MPSGTPHTAAATMSITRPAPTRPLARLPRHQMDASVWRAPWTAPGSCQPGPARALPSVGAAPAGFGSSAGLAGLASLGSAGLTAAAAGGAAVAILGPRLAPNTLSGGGASGQGTTTTPRGIDLPPSFMTPLTQQPGLATDAGVPGATPVPEPASVVVIVIALAGTVFLRRFRRHAALPKLSHPSA